MKVQELLEFVDDDPNKSFNINKKDGSIAGQAGGATWKVKPTAPGQDGKRDTETTFNFNGAVVKAVSSGSSQRPTAFALIAKDGTQIIVNNDDKFNPWIKEPGGKIQQLSKAMDPKLYGKAVAMLKQKAGA